MAMLPNGRAQNCSYSHLIIPKSRPEESEKLYLLCRIVQPRVACNCMGGWLVGYPRWRATLFSAIVIGPRRQNNPNPFILIKFPF